MIQPISAASLAVLLLISACSTSQPPVTTSPATPGSQQVTLNQELRPGTKGQRLELLEGELLIPAGTSAFMVQSANHAQHDLAMRQSPLLEWLMPSAQAQELTPESGDEDIDMAQLQNLQATVDGEPVDLEVLSATENAQGDLLVHYRLKNVPITEDNAIIEFFSPSQAFKLKGVVPPIGPDLRRLEQRLDLESTAVVEAFFSFDARPRGLSREHLEQLKRTDMVQGIRDVIYAHFVAPPHPQPPPRFDDLRRGFPPPAQAPRFREYVDQFKNCQQNPRACARPPQPPMPVARPIPAPIQQQVQRRQAVRQQQRLLRPLDPIHSDFPPPPPISSTELSAEQLERLLAMGPLMRAAFCREHQINPCPGLL